MVFLHGTRMTSTMWKPCAQLLTGCEVAIPDLPGHGVREGHAFDAETVEAVIDEAVGRRRPGQPVVLVGHSLGGYLAAWWAARHPYEIDGLVLVGASADPRSRWAATYRLFAALVPRIGPERMARFSNRVMALLRIDERPGPGGYAVLAQAWQLVMAECHPDLLAELDCPIVLANGQWDQMRLHEDRYAAAGRDTRVVTVPGATHLAPMTHPAQIAATISQVISTL